MFDQNHGFFESKIMAVFYDNYMTLLLQFDDIIQWKSFDFFMKKLNSK